jgi:transcriptional regulator GlxA family with amidase domain
MAVTPKKYGMVLYEGFQLLDVAGPLDVLNLLSTHVDGISLSLVAETLQPQATSPKCLPENMGMKPFATSQVLIPDHTFETAPQFDVLIIPGGMGCFDPNDAGKPNLTILNLVIQFILSQYPKLQYLLTVCTGSGITSLTGLLDGKKATGYKGAWKVIPPWRPQVNWVPSARWVVDGNIWTSSGVSSGIDLVFAFVEAIYGGKIAQDIAVWMEYNRHLDPNVDPFGIQEN